MPSAIDRIRLVGNRRPGACSGPGTSEPVPARRTAPLAKTFHFDPLHPGCTQLRMLVGLPRKRGHPLRGTATGSSSNASRRYVRNTFRNRLPNTPVGRNSERWFPADNPLRAIRADAAARHNAMQMRMQMKVLTPGVENGQEPWRAAPSRLGSAEMVSNVSAAARNRMP